MSPSDGLPPWCAFCVGSSSLDSGLIIHHPNASNGHMQGIEGNRSENEHVTLKSYKVIYLGLSSDLYLPNNFIGTGQVLQWQWECLNKSFIYAMKQAERLHSVAYPTTLHACPCRGLHLRTHRATLAKSRLCSHKNPIWPAPLLATKIHWYNTCFG